MKEMTIFRDSAGLYAENGLKIIPVWSIVKNKKTGELECGSLARKRRQAKQYNEPEPECQSPGKEPCIPKWQSRASFDPKIHAQWDRSFKNPNIGVPTGIDNGVFVVDVDGDEGKASLAHWKEKGLVLPRTLTSETGSGGLHLFFKYPAQGRVKNSVSRIAHKIDIRGDGGFVVAPPSKHRSGGSYSFIEGVEGRRFVVAAAPQWLLDLVLDAEQTGKRTRGDSYESRRIATENAGSDHKAASRQAEAGGFEASLTRIGDCEGQDGFDSPINSAACAYYAGNPDADSEVLKVRLREVIKAAYEDPARPRRQRYLSDEYLDRRIEEARAFVAKEAGSVSNDLVFDDEDDLVDYINMSHAMVTSGNSMLYVREKDGRIDLHKKQTVQDLLKPVKLVRVVGQRTKLIDGFNVWIASPKRRIYDRFVFEPGGCSDRCYNLWRGFSVEPKQGSWQFFNAHLFNVVCQRDETNYAWLIAWMAHLFQFPGDRPGTAVVLRGRKGTGKSTVYAWLAEILGQYSFSASNPNHITGRFNGHMEAALLANFEEGWWAGDKQGEGVLKALITEPTMLLERKNVDPVNVSNHLRVWLTTNAEWAVPATLDERRFFVLDVSDEVMQDTNYFAALRAEFENGGPAAMLHDLLNHQWEAAVDLRNPPKTRALVDQVVASFPPRLTWWYSVLEEGDFLDKDHTGCGEVMAWENHPIVVSKATVFESFNAFVPGIKGKPTPPHMIGKFLREMVPGLDEVRRVGNTGARGFVFPDLASLRNDFTERYRVTFAGIDTAASPGHRPASPANLGETVH